MSAIALVLGDQLWLGNPALEGLERTRDRVLMIEAPGEATQVWSHKQRIALFLAAMRHFAERLRGEGYRVEYVALGDAQPDAFGARLAAALRRLAPSRLLCCEPGAWRLQQAIAAACREAGVPLEIRPDRHFIAAREDFARWAKGRKQLRMEHFYREMRRRTGVLMDGGVPAGGRWNFDAENRSGFPRSGPGEIAPPARFPPDAITRAVLVEVTARFPAHPGTLEDFGWPVTEADAQRALARFVEARLENFGRYQDAMWTDTPFGWHSLLSAALNLHLIDPRTVIAAAEQAWRAGRAPLAAVEGFVRQVLGWREFMRGVYWLDMPALAEANHFGAARPLPEWYWNGRTQMRCMAETIGQTLRSGYAHHIQRLMVTGNFALLAGLDPRAVSDWYLAIFVDAVEWVELPNVAGMALYANGGRFTSKPYAASGRYVARMSNYCKGCRYRPEARAGEDACPMTVLYWNFLLAHETEFGKNPRMAQIIRNAARFDAAERRALRARAARMLDNIAAV